MLDLNKPDMPVLNSLITIPGLRCHRYNIIEIQKTARRHSQGLCSSIIFYAVICTIVMNMNMIFVPCPWWHLPAVRLLSIGCPLTKPRVLSQRMMLNIA